MTTVTTESTAKLSGGKATAIRKRRILVADDNRDSANCLAAVLRADGHETRVVYNGVGAFEMAERFRPDLVFLDLGMPRMDGFQVAKKIRAQPWSKEIRLYALTGWGQDRHRQLSHEAGIDGHLVKPASRIDIMKILSQDDE